MIEVLRDIIAKNVGQKDLELWPPVSSGTGAIGGGSREIVGHGRSDTTDNTGVICNDPHITILIGHHGSEIAAANVNGIVVYGDGLGMDVNRGIRLIKADVDTASGQGVESAHVRRGIGHGQIGRASCRERV